MTQIDIFSDVICPWCFIGKRRLERALKARPLPSLTIQWRAFQLNPEMPTEGMDRQAYLESKFGGPDRATQIYDNIRRMGDAEGIDFRFDLIQRTPNTVLAHRTINLATVMGTADALVERMFNAYFTKGVDIGDIDKLVELAEQSGMKPDDTREWLESTGGTSEVMAETRFAYENGINGVPCFIFNRQYAVSGAQEPEAFFPLFDMDNSDDTVVANQA
ncbi:DsbA family oxidoreductase [uncultured Nisaea sp.]|jgi:predicted DsbA family dithiol-disulfide isomerase|uniref:DsbA family oxidoreductase n=1 Tax=uncultured Nisaea sp. TaxID=538215 RepID=UPI0030ED9706|tara:strand:+ start:364 stop:1017 length:654 start_codon:yes stop_codon:yes gene_type:complete